MVIEARTHRITVHNENNASAIWAQGAGFLSRCHRQVFHSVSCKSVGRAEHSLQIIGAGEPSARRTCRYIQDRGGAVRLKGSGLQQGERSD